MIPAEWNAEWTAALVNHLWQSTAAVGIAWLLALLLRKHHARARYWVWLAASIKFLLPFSLLFAAGERLRPLFPSQTTTATLPATNFVGQIAQPFPQTQFASVSVATRQASLSTAHANWLPFLLLFVWICGALWVALRFGRGWWKIFSAARRAKHVETIAGLSVRASPAAIEPGIFGIIRPVLLLPAGIRERLTTEQLRAIMAHELCHLRRRDNLTFTIHMLVETLFWFHPLVWWMEARLVEERERACDETVVQSGNVAQIYAEGILNVCKFYVESPLPCAAGVTGSDLKKRILRIMTMPKRIQLTWRTKSLLALAALIAVALPVVFGLERAAAQAADDSQAKAARLMFEAASIRPSTPDSHAKATGMIGPPRSGLLSANFFLIDYIKFAYDLSDSDPQNEALDKALHGIGERYDIEARAEGVPTETQMRQMLRSLLEDRFKLKVHYETRQAPVYTLILDTPGKLGPQLRVHSESTPCTHANRPAAQTPSGGKTLPLCGEMHSDFDQNYLLHTTMTAVTMNSVTGFLGTVGKLQGGLYGLPILDQTGLKGEYDLQLQFSFSPPVDAPDIRVPGPGNPTLVEALKKQLGLRLVKRTGPVKILIVDHVEKPSPN